MNPAVLVRRSFRVLLAGLAVLLLPAVVPTGAAPVLRAQEADVARPLFTLNVASVDRVLHDLEFIFQAADRPELSGVVEGLLSIVGDLKGLDRERPFGVMLFLTPGFPPQIEPVTYLPARNLDDLMRTLSIGPVSTRKVPGQEGRYELDVQRETLYVRLRNEFALMARTPEMFDRELPDPGIVTRHLTSRYDLALTVNLDAVPETTKSFLLDLLRAQTEAELQQRDNEPDAAYRVRRARGMSNLELIDQVLTHGQDLTLGLDASAEQKQIVIEGAVNAVPDSSFAEYLQNIGGKPSRFSPLLDDPAPLTISTSWNLDERGKKTFVEGLDAARDDLTLRLAEIDPEGRAVQDLFESLKATAEDGHVDFFTRFQGKGPGSFVLIGGLRVLKTPSLADGLSNLLTGLRDRPELESLQVNADQHAGIAFHRIVGRDASQQDERLYGGRPAVYLGAGSNTLWFAIGGDDALPALKDAMDRISEADPAALRQPAAPFRLVANASSWLAIVPQGDAPNPGRELAQDAFSKGADRIVIDVRPTDTGARIRIQLEEAFLRFLGLSMARQIDRRL